MASFEIPAAAKMEISAQHQQTNADMSKADFKGKVKLSLTFSSGEVMRINADELQVVSAAPKQ